MRRKLALEYPYVIVAGGGIVRRGRTNQMDAKYLFNRLARTWRRVQIYAGGDVVRDTGYREGDRS